MTEKKRSLAETHPEIAKEADGWDPEAVTFGSDKKLSWKCKQGHSYITSAYKRCVRNQGCPYCSNKKVLAGFNDLFTTDPSLADEAFGWDPKEITAGSAKVMQWKCKEDHKWFAPVSRRKPRKGRARQTGCPYCSNRALIFGSNDLVSTHPEIAKEADGWDPRSVVAGSGSRRSWICSQGHRWTATVNHRKQGTGCPICSGQKIEVGFNDLVTTHPEIAKEADGWDPTTRGAGSGFLASWRCAEGHQYKSRIIHRRNGVGCPYCSNYKVLTGFNDLTTRRPDLAMEAYGWDPREVVIGSARKLSWICQNGHKWRTTVDSRISGRGCPSCAKSGFDPNEKSWLYFLNHTEWKLLQIGITNHPENRLTSHSKLGWEVIELRGPMDGHLVQDWETAILSHIKRQGGKFANKMGIEPFDGYSESWLKESFSFVSLGEIMEEINEGEE